MRKWILQRVHNQHTVTWIGKRARTRHKSSIRDVAPGSPPSRVPSRPPANERIIPNTASV